MPLRTISDEVQRTGEGGARVWSDETEVRIYEGPLPRVEEKCPPIVCHLRTGEPVPGAKKLLAGGSGVDRQRSLRLGRDARPAQHLGPGRKSRNHLAACRQTVTFRVSLLFWAASARKNCSRTNFILRKHRRQSDLVLDLGEQGLHFLSFPLRMGKGWRLGQVEGCPQGLRLMIYGSAVLDMKRYKHLINTLVSSSRHPSRTISRKLSTWPFHRFTSRRKVPLDTTMRRRQLDCHGG
jgi:hypothetical protein